MYYMEFGLQFEHELISRLDALVEGGKGDEQYKELFHEMLVDECQQKPLIVSLFPA